MSDEAKAPTLSRCNNKGCLVNSDCKSNQVCTLWRDCPSIATYGQKRCFKFSSNLNKNMCQKLIGELCENK